MRVSSLFGRFWNWSCGQKKQFKNVMNTIIRTNNLLWQKCLAADVSPWAQFCPTKVHLDSEWEGLNCIIYWVHKWILFGEKQLPGYDRTTPSWSWFCGILSSFFRITCVCWAAAASKHSRCQMWLDFTHNSLFICLRSRSAAGPAAGLTQCGANILVLSGKCAASCDLGHISCALKRGALFKMRRGE